MGSAAFLHQRHSLLIFPSSSLSFPRPKSVIRNHFSFSLSPPYNRKLLSICCALAESGRQSFTDEDKEKEEKEDISSSSSRIGNSGTIISSCVVGVLTGLSIVVFNNAIHGIREFFWDGIPHRGASWLREESLDSIWTRVIIVPACGGFIVGILNAVRSFLDENNTTSNPFEAALSPFLKAVAACFTLGTGNSLGPEGPSVEIGSSIAKGIGSLSLPTRGTQTRFSLLAAGSAAGIASGFNAAVAGCFFAVESVLWPSSSYSSPSLTNTTSMVILSAVIASVVSEVGLGSEPAFKVPEYDFRSIGGMAYGKLIGFAVARSSPVFHLSVLEVASPQAYGLVGMAATLAGVCQVPLTAVLLLFELTQDYRIVIPLLGAVGLSSWITAGQTRRKDVRETRKVNKGNAFPIPQPEISSDYTPNEIAPHASNLCEVESSLCIDVSSKNNEGCMKRIFVSEAMRIRYVTVCMSTLVSEAVNLMLAEKQSCAMIVDSNNVLIGLLTLGDIEGFSKIAKAEAVRPK